jgi:hypothetical protein
VGESVGHLFLKKVGKLFLFNQGCYLVDTEVELNHVGLMRFCDLDSHTVIDALGVGLRYFTHEKRRIRQEELDGFSLRDPQRYEFGHSVLRGVEVKVSRSDFKNGFICSGCNYHYLLTPMRLVAPHEVPDGVGLIEFNRYKFECHLNGEEGDLAERRPYKIKGLRVLKRPRYRGIPQFQIDDAIARMLTRRQGIDHQAAFYEVQHDLDEVVYRHP